jgi:hypothetical protein
MRSLVSASVRGLEILEAEDGAEAGLPIFDKSDLDRATQWISAQAGEPFGLA